MVGPKVASMRNGNLPRLHCSGGSIMQRIPLYVFVTLIPYLLVSTYAAGQTLAPVGVTAEGRVTGTDPVAMERAKDLALRRAVEEAVSSFISTQTKTSD